MSQIECKNYNFISTQFLQRQKNRIIDLQESLERHFNVLHLFGFNSAKFDVSLMKPYLLPNLDNEHDIEPTVVKKSNQLITIEVAIGSIDFLGGATSLASFLKAYKKSETKDFLYDCFDHPDKMQNRKLIPFDGFYSKLHRCIRPETEYMGYHNLLKIGLTKEQAVIKLKPSQPPPTGIEIYQYLKQIW